MDTVSKIMALIPARSGSKGILDKNIRLFNGKPLLAYSIEAARKAELINRVIVSTDSEIYADIARKYGAEAPFLRPEEISGDGSLDIEVFEHALSWLKDKEDYVPDMIVHLRPTHPIRNPKDIDAMLEILIHNPQADAVRSISAAKSTPYKMWERKDDGQIIPVIKNGMLEAYNMPRQQLPKVYMQNACIDVIRTETITKLHSMTGSCIHGYLMDYDFDIDSEADFLRAEQAHMLLQVSNGKKLEICCDIDGIIASKTQGNDYSLAKPMLNNIRLINALYEQGHEIILFTARGYKTGIDWSDLTAAQMQEWGVKYSKLKFGKPNADIYIDDKLADLNMIAEIMNIWGE